MNIAMGDRYYENEWPEICHCSGEQTKAWWNELYIQRAHGQYMRWRLLWVVNCNEVYRGRKHRSRIELRASDKTKVDREEKL